MPENSSVQAGAEGGEGQQITTGAGGGGGQSQPQQGTDRGFPADTPIAQMTDAQQAAYWKHYARQHEDTVKGFKGMTPQQVSEMQTQLDTLQTEKMTADEKAIKAARDEAAAAARAEFLPQLQASSVRSIAAEVIKGDQLTAFMQVVNPSAFANETGEVDETKVMAALTGMFGQSQQRQPAGQQQRWQNAGQFATPPPATPPGAGGRSEAARRFGTRNQQ